MQSHRGEATLLFRHTEAWSRFSVKIWQALLSRCNFSYQPALFLNVNRLLPNSIAENKRFFTESKGFIFHFFLLCKIVSLNKYKGLQQSNPINLANVF